MDTLELDEMIRAFERFEQQSNPQSAPPGEPPTYTTPPGKNHINNHEIEEVKSDFPQTDSVFGFEVLFGLNSLEEIRALEPKKKALVDSTAVNYMLSILSEAGRKEVDDNFTLMVLNPNVLKEYAEMRNPTDWDNFICPTNVDPALLEPYRPPNPADSPFPRQQLAQELAAIYLALERPMRFFELEELGMETADMKFDLNRRNRIEDMAQSAYINQKALKFLKFLQEEYE